MWLPTNCMLEFLCSPPLPRSVMWAHRADSSPPLHNSSPRHHTKPQSPLSTSLATGLASRVVMGITVASHGVQRSAQSFKPLSLCSPCNVLAYTPSTQSLPLKHTVGELYLCTKKDILIESPPGLILLSIRGIKNTTGSRNVAHSFLSIKAAAEAFRSNATRLQVLHCAEEVFVD